MERTTPQVAVLTQIDIEQIVQHSIQSTLEKLSPASPKDDKGNELMKPKEVAGLFGVSLVTLRHWDKEGILKPCYMKSRKFYYKSEVHAALKNRKRYGRK